MFNMSLVENIISNITTQNLGGITFPQDFELQDDTFSKLLEKQLSEKINSPADNIIGNIGIPAGLIIEPLDGINFAETAHDQMEILTKDTYSKEEYINQPIEMKDINLNDYFSNLIKTSTDSNSDFMNFAKKQATNAYNMFSNTFVSNITDILIDANVNL